MWWAEIFLQRKRPNVVSPAWQVGIESRAVVRVRTSTLSIDINHDCPVKHVK